MHLHYFLRNIQLNVPGPRWAEVFIESHPKTTEGFKRSGLQFLTKVISEVANAEQFVKSNSAKYREAVATKNTEVMTNLADGLRNCFPTLLDFTHSSNRGNKNFGGQVIEMDDAFKKKLLDLLNKFQRVYRDIAILLAKNYIEEHAAKSTLKKIFRHTLTAHQNNSYLEKELYLYCSDIHLHVQDELYSS